MRSRALLWAALWLAPSLGWSASQVDAEFRAICPQDPSLCSDCQALKNDVARFLPNENSKPPSPTADQISSFNQRFDSLGDRADLMTSKMQDRNAAQKNIVVPAFGSLRGLLNAVTNASTPGDLSSISKTLAEQERALEELQIDVGRTPSPSPPALDAFRRRLRCINAAGTEIWRRLKTDSLNIDRMDHPTKEVYPNGQRQVVRTDAGALQGEANPLQTRVAALSRGVQDLDAKIDAGLRWKGLDAASRKTADAGKARAQDMLKDPFDRGTSPAAESGGAGALADMRHVPSPSVEPKEVPPIFTGRPTEDSDPLESNRVALLRQVRMTKIVGDPAGRAKYVFGQSGETCAIAAQVTILEEVGAVGTDDKSRKAAEDALYERAAKEDLFSGSAADPKRRFHGGTPNQYAGDLLGIPVLKHYAAGDDELFKAVSTGKTVIVGVNAGALWNDPKYANAGHYVTITGAEINRATGALLGYYINDTGRAEGARFVTAGQFLDAWHRHSRVFVEPQ